MKASLVLVSLLLAGPAPPAGSAALPGDPLDLALVQAQKKFLSHQPGQPYLLDAIDLPPYSGDAKKDARRGAFMDVLFKATVVQEGCVLPCASDSDVARYVETVRAAAALLKIPADEIPGAVENYAPRLVPRKRGAPVPAAPAAAGTRARESGARDLSTQARLASAAGAKAAKMAALLDQSKTAGDVRGGGAAAAGAPLSPAERSRRLASARSAPAGARPRLKIVAPPSPSGPRSQAPPCKMMNSQDDFWNAVEALPDDSQQTLEKIYDVDRIGAWFGFGENRADFMNFVLYELRNNEHRCPASSVLNDKDGMFLRASAVVESWKMRDQPPPVRRQRPPSCGNFGLDCWLEGKP